MIRKEDKDYIDQRFKDTSAITDAKLSGISGKITAGFDMVQLQLAEIIEHQKRTNGNVKKNAQEIYDLQSQTRFVRWVCRNPQYAVPVIVLLVFGLYFAITYFGLEFILKMS